MLDIFLWMFTIYGLYRLIVDIIELKDVINNKPKIVIRVSNSDEAIINAIMYILQNERDLIIRIEDVGLPEEMSKKFFEMKKQYNNLEVLKL